MKSYAQLNSLSVVENIIVASSLEMAELVTSSYCVLIPLGTDVKIGYSYSNQVFSAPEEETPA